MQLSGSVQQKCTGDAELGMTGMTARAPVNVAGLNSETTQRGQGKHGSNCDGIASSKPDRYSPKAGICGGWSAYKRT